MKRIDVHTHVVETLHGFARRGEFRAVGGGCARWATGEEMPLFPPELGDVNVTGERLHAFLQQQGVERAVLLQGSFYGYQNEYSLEVARAYPEMFLAACTADPFALEAKAILERFVLREGLRVVKFELSSGGGLMGYHTPFAIDGPRLQPLIELAAKAGCTLVLDIGGPGMESFQPEAVAEIAKAHPQMRMVICHMLAPTLRDGAALEKALKLLRFPNLWFDLSAIPWNVQPETYPYPTGQRYIAVARDTIGHDKLLWGSDLPCPMTLDSYEHLTDYLQKGDLFTDRQLEDVYYHNALRAYPFH
ncbi:MAG: amidohydrolase family protein [Candidatus Limiplasma sp.]|nr:amidohydrolase family protein [Candidatus Limiplasma sp.]